MLLLNIRVPCFPLCFAFAVLLELGFEGVSLGFEGRMCLEAFISTRTDLLTENAIAPVSASKVGTQVRPPYPECSSENVPFFQRGRRFGYVPPILGLCACAAPPPSAGFPQTRW